MNNMYEYHLMTHKKCKLTFKYCIFVLNLASMWANLQKDEKFFDFNLRSNRVEHSSSLVILPSLYFRNVWFSVNPSDNNSSAHIKVTFFRVYGIGRDFIKIGFLVFFPPSVLVRLSVTLFTWSICRFTELGNGGQNKRTNDCSSGKLHYVLAFQISQSKWF